MYEQTKNDIERLSKIFFMKNMEEYQRMVYFLYFIERFEKENIDLESGGNYTHQETYRKIKKQILIKSIEAGFIDQETGKEKEFKRKVTKI